MAGALAGLTFLNLREAAAAGRLTRLLEREGGAVIEQPVLEFVPPADWGPFDAALDSCSPGQWAVFSSPTAVRFTLLRMAERGIGPETLSRARVAAVGPGTADALEAAGIPVALVPERHQAEGLLEALLAQVTPGTRVWQPRAEEARPVLEEGLAAAGVTLLVTPAYRTVMPEGGLSLAREPLLRGEVDWLIFTSSSTVRHFTQMLDERTRPAGQAVQVACLGTITAETAEVAGFQVAVVPERQDLEGLVTAIAGFVQGAGAKD